MANRLSDRQRECAELFARGMSAKDIARHVGRSEGTVRKHLQEAYARLGVTGRGGLARALGINQVGQESPIPPHVGSPTDVAVDGGLGVPEADRGKRSAYEIYAGLGPWRTPPRRGGRIVPIFAVAVLIALALGAILSVLAFAYGVINSVDVLHRPRDTQVRIDKNAFAISMARTVRSVEHRLDDTLSACGDMLQQFSEGRRASNLAAEVGQPALERFTLFTHQMVQARGTLVGVHQVMATEGERIGMIVDPLEGKPEPGKQEPTKGLIGADATA